jgi:hypothetical protein
MAMLGVAKLLGITALLVPSWPRLKEVGLRGLRYQPDGAARPHAAVSQYNLAALALAWLAVQTTSYISFRKRRTASFATQPVAPRQVAV